MQLKTEWNNNPLSFRSGRHFMSGTCEHTLEVERIAALT